MDAGVALGVAASDGLAGADVAPCVPDAFAHTMPPNTTHAITIPNVIQARMGTRRSWSEKLVMASSVGGTRAAHGEQRMCGRIGFTLGRMTRIIAGEFGGRKLAVPKVGTRPTTDRVREAIFSRLDHADALRGSCVLDLYAGSGALGLEALSRGAAEATFVESATPAVRIVEANIKEFGLGTRAAVVRERVLPFLERVTKSFTLAFLDPPYDIADGDLVAALAALAGKLEEASPVVLEVSTRKRPPEWPCGLQLVQSKSYGETTVHFAERVR